MITNLYHLNSAWKNAKADTEFITLPDGEHTLIVSRTEVTTTKGGTPVLEWLLETQGGQLVKKSSFLTEASFGMLKRDFKAAGVDPDLIDINRIDEWANCLCGSVIGVTATSSTKLDKTYHNINFRCLIQPSGNPLPDIAQTAGFAPVAEDQLPF